MLYLRYIFIQITSKWLFIEIFGLDSELTRTGYFSPGRAVEPVICAKARGSERAQKSENGLIFGHILLFWVLKSVEFLQIWAPALKSRYEFRAKKRQKKIHRSPEFFLPGPVHALYVPESKADLHILINRKKRIPYSAPGFPNKKIS